MDIVLDVAFIVAVTAFAKEQLELKGKAVLGVAFVVVLVVAFLPLVGGLFPDVSPWLERLTEVIALFLAAAGSYDAIMDWRYKSIQ